MGRRPSLEYGVHQKNRRNSSDLYGYFYTDEGKNANFDSSAVGRRIERASSITYYENGFTQSFFSCSKSGFDTTFAQKSNIVLIEMELARNVPCIDYEKILSRREYRHWDEREILLPPFLNIEITEMPLTVSETRRIKDLNKRPPLGKYRLKAVEFPDYRKSFLDSEKIIWQQICDGKESAAHLLEMMHKKDKEQDYEEYIGWKEKLHQYLKIQFSNPSGDCVKDAACERGKNRIQRVGCGRYIAGKKVDDPEL